MRATLNAFGEADHDALDPLCEALGVDARRAGVLDLSIDGRKVSVSIGNREQWDTSRTRVTVQTRLRAEVNVFFERGRAVSDEARKNPPSIVLRREVAADVADKDRGLVKELQTGFAGFDHAVFIDHDATDADARRVLAKEATRQAVIALIDQGLTVHWGLRSVRLSVPVDTERPPDARYWAAVLEDVLIASKAGGLRDAPPARKGEALLTVSIVAAALSAVWAAVADRSYRADTVLPWLVVVVIGVIVAFFTRPFLEQGFRGHSASAKWSAGATLCWALTAGFLSLGTLLTANATFDTSEPRARHGVVLSTSRRSSLGRYSALVRWNNGSQSTITGTGWFEDGEKITEVRREGALGFEWSWIEQRR
ncbi:MAG: hypothetical protein U0228_19255 [Myxococcaceae bacterium]